MKESTQNVYRQEVKYHVESTQYGNVIEHLKANEWDEFYPERQVVSLYFDTSKLEMSTIDIAVQINGKVRAIISIENNLNKEDVLIKAKEENKIKKYLDKKEIKKEIYIPGKIINFVVY